LEENQKKQENTEKQKRTKKQKNAAQFDVNILNIKNKYNKTIQRNPPYINIK